MPAWRCTVTNVTEARNKSRLLEDCHKKVNNETIPKTKTKTIVDKVSSNFYIGKPLNEFVSLTKNEGRSLIIARYGMLECGQNFKGTISSQCLRCDVPDNENHRLNVCPNYSNINFVNDDQKIPFDSIYSDNVETLRVIILRINQLWNLKNGHGSMKII